MRHLVHISRKKILNQIIIGNIIIAISTIAIIGIIATYTSAQHINKEFINGNMAQMEYNAAQTENELERIVKIPYTLNSQNQNIQKLFDLSYKGDLIGLSLRFSEFVGLYADYSNVDSIWIYDGKHTIIDTDSGVKNISNFDGWKKLTELVDQASKNYMYMKPYISEMDSVSNFHNTISIVSPLNMSDSAYNSGCVIINLNMTGIIDSVSGSGKGYFFVVNTKNGKEIALRKQDLFSGDDIQRILNIKDSGNIDINGEEVHVCIKESSVVSDFIYVLAVPYNVMSGELRGMYLQFLLAVLFLILIEVIIVIVISSYIYEPFKTMFSNVGMFFSNEMEGNKQDTLDELAVIREYMSNLQEKLNSKSEKLVEYSSVIKQNVGQKIIEGDMDDEFEIRNGLEECGVAFDSEIFTVCIFMIDNWHEIANRSKEEALAIKTAFNEVIDSVYSGEFNCICTIPQNDRVTFIIESGRNAVENRIDKSFDTVNDILRLQVSETVSMARISGITPITAISERYPELLELAKDRFNCGRQANIKDPVDKIDRKEAQKSYQTFMRSIKRRIADKDVEGASAAVNLFVDNVKRMSTDSIKAIILSFAYTMKNEYRATEAADYIQNNIDDILKYSTADDLGAYLTELLRNIIMLTMENSNDNITSKIKEYIDNNLNEDLSLVALGDKFNLTPAYLSTLFKSTQRIGVVDYINKSRIEKAKELLTNTNMSIKDISEEVGFMNYNSFARVFKKYTGVSAKTFKLEIDSRKDVETHK